MGDMVYRIIAIVGLLIIVLGNYFSLKTATRKKYTYLLFILGSIALLLYSLSIEDIIFTILQAIVIITSIWEYYMVHVKKTRSPKIQKSKLKS